MGGSQVALVVGSIRLRLGKTLRDRQRILVGLAGLLTLAQPACDFSRPRR
jgi:hypothetical protein